MILEIIETAIVTKLATDIDVSQIDSLGLPEVEADFNRPVDKGQLTVAIAGVEYGEHRNIGSIVQYPKVRIEVVMKARKLRGNYGIYDLERRVRSSLVNYRPLNDQNEGGASQGLKPLQMQLNSYNEGVWSYSMFFECSTTAFQEYAEYDDDTPRITEITLDETIESNIPN